MKTALFLLAILGLSQGATIVQPVKLHEVQVQTSRALIDDLREFLALIPGDQVLEIIINNLGDPQLQQVIVYIFSAEFAQLVVDVEAIPEYNEVIAYLEGAGLPVTEWIAAFKDFLGISRARAHKSTRGLNEIVAEIIAVIPVDEMSALYQNKLQTSPAFADLIKQLNSPTFKAFAHGIASNPEVIRIAQELRDMGVPIDDVIAAIKNFFGITKSLKNSRALIDDLREFLALIPGDQVLEIIINNLGDPQLQQVIVYIFSAEFAQLVVDVEAIPEYGEVIAYLEGAGLPVTEWIAAFKDFLGISRARAHKSTRGLNEIVAEIIAVIPVDEMSALYQNKLQTSPAFADLIKQLNSPTFKAFAHGIASNPEVIRIAQELRDMGVPIDDVIAAIKDFFGITKSLRNTRALIDDLREFLALIPGDQVLEIIINNLGDPQLQQVIVYIFSAEFAQLVVDVEAIPEYGEVIAYLEGAGLPVTEWIAAFKDFLGISRARAHKSTRGLNEIVAEIIAVIPVDEMSALYQNKLQTSPAFADLIKQLNSPTFKAFAHGIASNPEVIRIAQELRDMGVPIDDVIAAIKDFFGITKSLKNTRALIDDLREFLALIPGDLVLEIIINNLGDPQLQQVIVYIFSAEFAQLVVDVEAIPEYGEVIAYLEGAGLPVTEWIAAFKDFLGISRARAHKSTRGLNEIVAEIIAVIPVDEMSALYQNKLQTSPAFADLIEQLNSPTFKAFAHGIASNPEVNRIAQVLRDMGVPIDDVIAAIKDFFGITRRF